MDVLVAVKQVPKSEALALDADGRLARAGVALEMNAYCRRALAKGIEIAHTTGGSCRVVTLGPPAAERVLREALACGADEALLLSDPALAGSDTLVTARALAALVGQTPPVDLVLVGKASLDAETGQVGPQLAELLDLPFAGAVRELSLDPVSRVAKVRCEQDDGGCDLVVSLPAVLALAERSCRPAKADLGAVEAVPAERVARRAAADLGVPGPWGALGSPTTVEGVAPVGRRRAGVVCAGPVQDQVDEALGLLVARGALDAGAPGPVPRLASARAAGGRRPAVAVVCEPQRDRVTGELLGAGAHLARSLGGAVTAFACGEVPPEDLWSRGADATVLLEGAEVEEDVAGALTTWALDARPEVILAPATSWGRQVAARAAARLGVGLVADALDLEILDGRLRCAKPACAGGAVATITSRSSIQMATVRPGALPLPLGRGGSGRAEVHLLVATPRRRVTVIESWRDDDVEALERAEVVVGVGLGVPAGDYGEVRRLARVLGAELGATRKVTDRGLLPRARQIGVTGRNIAPRLYLALGVSGSANHLAGVRRAGTVLAVNLDAAAPVFSGCDIGIVADWRAVAAELVDRLAAVRPPLELVPPGAGLPPNTGRVPSRGG